MINIPLFIFAYKKVGKMFAKLTLVYLFVNVAAGFGLSSIPGVSDIFIFGRTIPDDGNILTTNHVYVMPFYFKTDNKLIFDVDHDPIKSFFLFLTALIYGFISSIAFAMLYIVGSCTAGLDIISIFYATKKNKNISGMLVIINSISMIIGATLGSYLSGGIIGKANDVGSACFG
ncbi:MAG: YitT family protein [Mycoplasmoidaceae bacterium]|nr:YitT family protein [Mycoplasmoidaceae bacterium]